MITIIVAWAQNRLIGAGNKIPWHIPEELQHFKNTTLNSSVIMGRKTYESIGKPLINRINIVITSSSNFKDDKNLHFVKNLDEAIEKAKQYQQPIFIIGGRQVYQDALKIKDVNRMLISQIKGEFEGDIYFPGFQEKQWQKNWQKGNNKFKITELTRIK